ncbi:hypothetical protein ACQKE8_13085 [Sphingobium limneticum]|uniref:hypothetical protein n=1 Tax=Sphingobium limneticum TaxID=1007511 RepID=UPI003D08D785
MTYGETRRLCAGPFYSLASPAKLNAIKLALLLVVATTSGASAAPDTKRPSNQTPAQQSERQGSPQQNHSRAYQTAPKVVGVNDKEDADGNSTREQEAAARQKEERQFRQSEARLSVWQTVFSFLGTIFLLLTLVYTARAANAAKNSANHAGLALEHTVTAADAAGRSAGAAEAALAQAREQFAHSNRPWLSIDIEKIAVRSVGTEGFPAVQLVPNVVNIGSTPATDVLIHTVYTTNVDKIKEPIVSSEPPQGGHIIIPPGLTASGGIIMIKKQDYDLLRDKKATLDVRITVTYTAPLIDQQRTTVFVGRFLPVSSFDAFIANPAEGRMGFALLPGAVMI